MSNDLQLLVPAKVGVVYRAFNSAVQVIDEVALASLALPEYAGVTGQPGYEKVFHRYEPRGGRRW